MVTEELKNKLYKEVKGEVLFGEPLCEHSTIKIGGKAEVYIIPENAEELIKAVKITKESDEHLFCLGAGSNVLFRDSGFDGVVVSTGALVKVEVKEKMENGFLLNVEAGVMVRDIVEFALNEGGRGFEHLAGIPGTVGGALSMNAGTHGGVISDPLVCVYAVDKSGKPVEWTKEKIEFSYRKAKYPRSSVFLSADFFLENGNKEEILAAANELRERRKLRHPLRWPSLGSIFKNPQKGQSAGELIEDAGLKDVRVGGARISQEHANWIVNEGGAKAKDVEVLIHMIKEKVKDATGETLETEIVIVGNK